MNGRTERDQTLARRNDFSSRFSWRVPVWGALFLIIPVLFLVTVAQWTKAKGPQWLPYSFENPYAYLFNSLLLVDGQAPEHTDHPGTTTQVFGAIVMRAFSTKSQEQLIGAVVQDPEKYLRKIHWALLLFTALTVWVCPWITALVLRNYLIGLLIQAPSLFYGWVLSYALFFGSDLMVVPFSIATVCLCSLLIAPWSTSKHLDIGLGFGPRSIDPASMRVVRIPAIAGLIGFMCALGIVTKLTFFPLILISLFCCWTVRNAATFASSFLLGLMLALLPIYSKLGRLGGWILALSIHRGTYGTGAIGLPNGGEYLGSIVSLIGAEPLVVTIPLAASAGVIVLSLANIGSDVRLLKLSWRTALPLLGLQLGSFLAIAKHPSAQYLIPLCVSTGFSLVVLYCVLRTAKIGIIRRVAGWVTLLGLLLVGFTSFAEFAPRTYAEIRDRNAALLRLYRRAKQITQNDVRVDYYFSDSPEFPLCYGNVFSRRVFGSLLANRHPKALFFDDFTGRFETFTDSIDPESVLRQHDHLYFLGNPDRLHNVDGVDARTFETIDKAGGFYLQKWTRH
jgi:hypothetical protein